MGKSNLVSICIPLLVFALVLVACSPSPSPTAIPTATATLAPTVTAIPSATATTPPTATATTPPTATSIPTTVVPTKPPATATFAAPTTPTQPITPVTATQPSITATAAAGTQPSVATATCLACHGGSFDKLIASNAVFKDQAAETVNPHRYVPHNLKDAKSIPDCTLCHTPHPLVAKPQVDLSTVNVDYCFKACHHQNDFTPCAVCHVN